MKFNKRSRILSAITWLYLAFMIIACAVLHFWGDQWWPATLMLFGPRWSVGLPLLILIPLALFRKWKLLLPLALTSVIFLWPFLGYHHTFSTPERSYTKSIRVLSCNTKNGQIDFTELSRLIYDFHVDVVSLQETPRDFSLILPASWHTYHKGIIAIFSRFPIKDPSALMLDHPPHEWKRHTMLACTLETPFGDVAFDAVYLPSARYGLQNIISKKVLVDAEKSDLLLSETGGRHEASRLVSQAISAQTLPVIIAGDFNTPRESTIYKEFWSRYQSAFLLNDSGYGWTFFDSFKGIPVPLAIDHILTGNGAVPLSFRIGPDLGSDHRPIIADISIAADN